MPDFLISTENHFITHSSVVVYLLLCDKYIDLKMSIYENNFVIVGMD